MTEGMVQMRCRWWWTLSAAALLFSWTRAGAEPEEVVAEIAGEEITRADLDRFRSSVQRTLTPETPAESDSALLRALVDKKALLLEAREQGVGKEAWLGRAVERFRKNQLIKAYVYREVTQKVSVSEEEVRAYFKKTHRDRALRISGMLLPTREEAEEAIQALDAGADFAEMSRERSLYDPARETGGDSMEYLKKDGIVEALHGIFELEVGELSEPIPFFYKGATKFAVIRISDEIPVNLGTISPSLADARARHPWIGELYEIKLKARRKALLDSLDEAYSPRETGRLHDLFGEFAAAGLESSPLPDGILCLYEGGSLSFEDFVTLVPEANLNPEMTGKPDLLESLLRERAIPARLFLEEMKHLTRREEDPELEGAVADKRDDLILSTLRKRVVDDRIPPPSAAESFAYYEAHPEQFQTWEEVVVIEILVAFRELARQLRDRLDAGEDAAELARLHTIREGTAHHDGLIELTKRSHFRELYKKAKGTRVGQVVGPVRLENGFSVFKVVENRPPEVKPFDDESRRRATGYLRIDALRRGFVEYARGLRRKYGARTYLR